MSDDDLLCPQLRSKAEAESRRVTIDFTPVLDGDEVITSVEVTSISPSGELTVTGEAVTEEAVEVLGSDVEEGMAVQCTVAGGEAATTYKVWLQATTDAGQTIVRGFRVRVV